jgi:hypothetical protein
MKLCKMQIISSDVTHNENIQKDEVHALVRKQNITLWYARTNVLFLEPRSLKNLFVLAHINSLNTELNLICHLLALLGAHHILHVGRIRVKVYVFRGNSF